MYDSIKFSIAAISQIKNKIAKTLSIGYISSCFCTPIFLDCKIRTSISVVVFILPWIISRPLRLQDGRLL